MIALMGIILSLTGITALLIGYGGKFGPARWRGREEAQWIGRFAVFFGLLFLLDAFGITPHQISSYLEDILTSGGGVGTG